MILLTKNERAILDALAKVSTAVKSFGGDYLVACNNTETVFLYAKNFGLPELFFYDIGTLAKAAKSLGDAIVEPDEKGLTLKSNDTDIFISYSELTLCKINLPAAPTPRKNILCEFDLNKDQLTKLSNISAGFGVQALEFQFSDQGLIVVSCEARADNRSVVNKFKVKICDTPFTNVKARIQNELLGCLVKDDYKVNMNDKSFQLVSPSNVYYIARKT